MNALPVKAQFVAKYDDGSEKMVVSYDTTSERLPDHVSIEMGSGWLYVDEADVPQLIAFLQRARKSILAVRAAKDAAE